MKRDSNDGQLSFDVTVSVLCALVIRSQVDSLFRCCHRRNAETSGKKKKCRRLPRLTPRLRGRVWQWKLPRLTHVTFRKKLTERLRKAKGTKKSRGKADFTKKKRIGAYNALVFFLAVLSLCFKKRREKPTIKITYPTPCLTVPPNLFAHATA